jgi:hypothetical protein
VLPLASSWPTEQKAQYVAIFGSSFGLQRYFFFQKKKKTMVGIFFKSGGIHTGN